MDKQVKSYFQTLRCPHPSTAQGTLTWTQQNLFGTPETARIEWSDSDMILSGQMDQNFWSLHLRKPKEGKADDEWDIVGCEGLKGGTPRAKLWRVRDMLITIRQQAPAPDEGWAPRPAPRKGPRP